MNDVLRPAAPLWRSPAFGVIAALHLAGLTALAHWDLQQPDSALAQILSVRLIEPEKPRLAEPKPLPPPPKPVPRPTVVDTPPPVLTAAAEAPAAPASFAVAPQPPAPPAPPPIQAAPPAPPAPLPVVAARFDAEYLNNPKPAYPPLSRRLGEEGKVWLRVRVGADGSALEVEIKQGSGHARLDTAARDAVARWRFVPARRGAEAIESWVAVPILFALEN